MAKNKKNTENQQPEAKAEDNEQTSEAQENSAPEQEHTQTTEAVEPPHLTEDDFTLGTTKVGCAGEYVTLKMSADHPLASKLLGRGVSLVVHFEAE